MPSTNFPISESIAAAEPTARSSYDPSCFDALAKVEDKHFWFRARAMVISTLARQVTSGMSAGYRVLEVGCGAGTILRALDQACVRGSVTGMDLYAEGLSYARRRVSCQVLQADLHAPPFAASFEMIGAFDVLEHLPDDTRVMRALHTMLKPGGALLVTVPAHPRLWSYFDEYSHHCRRYTPAELRRKLVESGYRIEYLSEYMAAIMPVMWLGRKLAGMRTGPRADLATYDLKVIPGVNRLLMSILSQEARLISQRRILPFGASLVAIARK